MPLILALGRQRQTDTEFKASLVYTASSRTARQKKTKKPKKTKKQKTKSKQTNKNLSQKQKF